MLMSFFNFEILKGKLTKFIWTMPQVKLSKTYVLGEKNWKQKNCNSYGLIWKYGQIQTIQKFQTIIWLKLTKNGSWFEFIISYYNTY